MTLHDSALRCDKAFTEPVCVCVCVFAAVCVPRLC